MKTPQIILIGQQQRREFSEFAQWLNKQSGLQVGHSFESLPQALQHSDDLQTADMTIVLQSRSDQHSEAEINALIGETLFRRLLCCYGPWCESDGRNRGVWPDANRVPLRIAARVVEWECLRIRAGVEAVPPTSARDEIFAYRLGEPDDWAPLQQFQDRNAVVIGADSSLRRTASQIVKSFGLRSTHLPLQTSVGRNQVKAMASKSGQIHFVLHDLDPWNSLVLDSIQAARVMFRGAEVLGLATMPDAGLAAEIEPAEITTVIPKLDLEDSLRFALSQRAATLI